MSAVWASSAVHPFLLDASFWSGALSSALSDELSSKLTAPSKFDGTPRVLFVGENQKGKFQINIRRSMCNIIILLDRPRLHTS